MTYNDFELRKLKLDLLSSICFLILDPANESVLVEGLRVVANLSKKKDIVKHLFSLNFEKALIILLEHQSQDVVFNSLGCLLNISNSDFFYKKQTLEELSTGLLKANITEISLYLLTIKLLSNVLNYLH